MVNDSRIIVIGGDHHNTLGVIRSLGEKGLKSDALIVTNDQDPFVGRSKYLQSVHIVSDNDQIAPYLMSKLRFPGSKPVVICCSDAASSEIDIHANELRPFFIIPGSTIQGQITQLMNKRQMAVLAEECGLLTPRSTYPSKLPIPKPELVLPCILKPLVSKDGCKDLIRICNSIEELYEGVELIGLGNVQQQQFIVKDFEYQLIGCSTGSEIIIPGVSHILRPCKGSNTSFLYYESLSKEFCNIDACKDFVKRTGYKGLFSMEFLRDKNGVDYFMEINFRNDGNAICVTAAGVNLPYIWYLSCTGQDISEETSKTIKAQYIMPDMAELKLAITGQISLFQYLGDLLKTNRFMEFDWKDQKPFWTMITQRIRNICRS